MKSKAYFDLCTAFTKINIYLYTSVLWALTISCLISYTANCTRLVLEFVSPRTLDPQQIANMVQSIWLPTIATLFSQGNKSPYEQISMSDLALILCWMLFLIQLCHLSGFWGLTSLWPLPCGWVCFSSQSQTGDLSPVEMCLLPATG